MRWGPWYCLCHCISGPQFPYQQMNKLDQKLIFFSFKMIEFIKKTFDRDIFKVTLVFVRAFSSSTLPLLDQTYAETTIKRTRRIKSETKIRWFHIET